MTNHSDSAYVYYTFVSEKLPYSTYMERLNRLPEQIVSRIQAYENQEDRQLRLSGKELLGDLLVDLQPENPASLKNLFYSAGNRPALPAKIDFNISHSGKLAACGATLLGHIGLDVEMIRPIHLADYQTYFSSKEWETILTAHDTTQAFYHFWTRKEALLKALGSGMLSDLSLFDTCSHEVDIRGSKYFLHTLPVDPDYIVHAAINHIGKIVLKEKTF
ncbi:MAG TPA: 4'-phosphopantetheinyl transferase superfamily protein [Bacteroidia bacterium]|jgi:4'-phosphopantetheinyl transferase|nr:4'-phosphopantetheinyl transferase superfamily protein [Bacteroidia bacterium]